MLHYLLVKTVLAYLLVKTYQTYICGVATVNIDYLMSTADHQSGPHYFELLNIIRWVGSSASLVPRR